MSKRILLVSVMVVCLAWVLVPQVMAQYDVDYFCRLLQQRVQSVVGNEDPGVYKNHGAYVSAAAHIVDPWVESGRISEECASCIISQFARSIPVEEQEPCGPAVEFRNLLGPEETACDGPFVGTIAVADLGPAGLGVRAEFISGPPNETMPFYWVCTTVANGCHESACNYITLGDISTDGDGKGVFTTILAGGNPYPGMYVHFDIGPSSTGDWYTSVWDVVFPSVAAAGVAPSPTADPKNR